MPAKALSWAEIRARLAEHHGERDADFALLQAQISDPEIIERTVAIASTISRQRNSPCQRNYCNSTTSEI